MMRFLGMSGSKVGTVSVHKMDAAINSERSLPGSHQQNSMPIRIRI